MERQAIPISRISTDLAFGEGPRWHRGRLWCSDMFRNRVQQLNDADEWEIKAHLDRPSGIGFLPDGQALVVSMRSATLHRILDDGSTEIHARLDEDGKYTLNDMLVMPAGDLYVDSYLVNPGYEAVDGIVHLSRDGVARRVATGLRRPNGLVASPDGRTLYVAETFGERVLRFGIRDDGSLDDAEVHAALPGRRPDGLALDAEGGIWAGCFDTGEFVRVDAQGAVTDVIATGGPWAVATALGGEDGRTLFMFSAEAELEGGFRQGIASGYLDVAHVDVPAA
jgi:sugar lactone lactonase YvrE